MKGENLLDYLIRVNTFKDVFITAFQDENGHITIWQEFPFSTGSTIYLIDKNLGEKEKIGKVWRLYRAGLTTFTGEKITWIEEEREFYKSVGQRSKYQGAEISWKGGMLNAEQASALLIDNVYKELKPGDFDRYFKKLIFGLVMAVPGQEKLNAEYYLKNFIDL